MAHDGWTLTIEFETVAEATALDRHEISMVGEAGEFYGYMCQYWDEDSVAECVRWDGGGTVVIQADVLDYINEPIGWVLSNTIPKSMTLVR